MLSQFPLENSIGGDFSLAIEENLPNRLKLTVKRTTYLVDVITCFQACFCVECVCSSTLIAADSHNETRHLRK